MSFTQKLKLHNGSEIPLLGLGTWKSQLGTVGQAVKDAIDIGYRHVDCAYVYGNEKEIGDAIREKIAEGVVKREDLFITSKLWNTYHKFESVEKGMKKSLINLGLDYLDLYLIHWPFAYADGDEISPRNPDRSIKLGDTDYLETWRGMEALYEKGLAKNIGISNFNSEQITRLLENCKVKPVVNQIECHPYLTQHKLSKFCKERDIVVVAYSPLGSPGRPWAKLEERKILEDKKLLEISEKYNKTIAQVVIRYQIDRGHVVIPKTEIKSRLLENFQVFDFKLSSEDISYIDGFNINERMWPFTHSSTSPHYPFHSEF